MSKPPTSGKLTAVQIIRSFLCRMGFHGGGRVVSGWRGDALMIGWRCGSCGVVKHYAPAGRAQYEERR